MKRSTLGIILAIVSILAIGGIVVANNKSETKNTVTTNTGHDETNSDGHHKDGKVDASGVEDLTTLSEVTMDIKEFAFTKKDIKIKKGTKVTWTNQDVAKHNAFSKDPNGPMGELLGRGESYSFVFNTTGKVNYYCEPHPYMKATVDVVE